MHYKTLRRDMSLAHLIATKLISLDQTSALLEIFSEVSGKLSENKWRAHSYLSLNVKRMHLGAPGWRSP